MTLIDSLTRLVPVVASPTTHAVVLSLRQVVAAAECLPASSRECFFEATNDVDQILEVLAARAETDGLDARDQRDLTTLQRRLGAVLGRVGVGNGRCSPGFRLCYARLDVAAVIRSVFASFEPVAAAHGIAFELHSEHSLAAEVDPSKVVLAVTSLLVHAIWHAPSDGGVHCKVDVDEIFDDLIVTVEHDGPPIPITQREAIFDHERVSDRNVPLIVGSRRLSLAEARDAVVLHGGALTLVPSVVGPTRFRMRLPRSAPRGASVVEAPSDPVAWLPQAADALTEELRSEAELGACPVADDDRPLVLVIEGSRALNRALVGCLEPEYATASAFTGGAGVELAIAMRPDVVVVDMSLPGGDGEYTAMSLRASDQVSSKVLAIAEGDDATQVLPMFDAVHDLVAKPILLAEVRARVRRLLASKKTQDMLGETIGQRDTDLIALAKEVAHTHKSLEQANTELDAARRRAEEASRTRSTFLRIMSHELKTPVTAMKLQLSVLERDQNIVRNDALEEALARFDRSIGRLLHLVDTALEWARAEDGRSRPSVEQIDVAQLVQGVVDELASVASARRLGVVVRIPDNTSTSVSNDGRLVRLVVRNLLEYALTASVEGPIVIRVGRADGGIRITIADTAPRLTPREREELLSPLGAGTDVHRRSGPGSGLGVSAVVGIARATGGCIEIDAPSGRGNRLVFHIPQLRVGANPFVYHSARRD